MRRAWFLAVVLSSLEVSAGERLRIQGAASVAERLADVVGDRFSARYADLGLEWSGAGSGGALGALFAGAAEIAINSRPASADELELARRLGLELEEVPLGLSGIAVVVHPDNDVPSLSLEELRTLYSGRIVRWLGFGGMDEAVHLLSLPEASGVRDVFEELVVGSSDEELAATTARLPAAALLERVASDRGAVGFVSVSAIRDRAAVRTVPITASQGDAPSLPSLETFSGIYPLRYPIWLYMLGEPTGELQRLITLLLLHDGPELLAEAGFLPLPSFDVVARSIERSRPRDSEVSVTRVGFGFRGSRLSRTARRDLEALAERLNGVEADLWITGHVEPTEATDGSPGLALARVESVVDVFVRAGVARSTMVLKDRGAREPVASNETPDGRRANRRADIWVVPQR